MNTAAAKAQTNWSALLDELIADGYIEQRTADGGAEVTFTQKGKEAFRLMLQLFDLNATQLGEDPLRVLRRVLEAGR